MSKCLPFHPLRDHVASTMKGSPLIAPWGEKCCGFFMFVSKHENYMAYNRVWCMRVCVWVCILNCILTSFRSDTPNIIPGYTLTSSITQKLSNPCPSHARTSQNDTSFFLFNSPKGFTMMHSLHDILKMSDSERYHSWQRFRMANTSPKWGDFS